MVHFVTVLWPFNWTKPVHLTIGGQVGSNWYNLNLTIRWPANLPNLVTFWTNGSHYDISGPIIELRWNFGSWAVFLCVSGHLLNFQTITLSRNGRTEIWAKWKIPKIATILWMCPPGKLLLRKTPSSKSSSLRLLHPR